MTPQFWLSIFLFLLAIAGLIFGIIKLSTHSANRHQEPGRVLIRLGINYTLSFIILIQIFLNIVEAGIVGSMQDANVNTAARMGGHFLIALLGILGALTWVKMFKLTISATMLREGDELAHGGKRFALFMVCFALMIIGLIALIGAPIANMYTLANATHNTRQLHLFLTWALDDRTTYMLALVEAGASPKYNPWDGLAGVMVFSVVLTITHMVVCVWEVFYALFLSMTKSDMTQAFEQDLYADRKQDDKEGSSKKKKKGGAGNDEEDDEEEDDDEEEKNGGDNGGSKKKKKAQHEILDKIWTWMGMDTATAAKWTDNVYPLMNKNGNGDKEQANVEFASSLSEIHRKIAHFEAKGHGPKKETDKEIVTELKNLIFKRSNRKLTLPGRKNA